jgi:hypothetical protein
MTIEPENPVLEAVNPENPAPRIFADRGMSLGRCIARNGGPVFPPASPAPLNDRCYICPGNPADELPPGHKRI